MRRWLALLLTLLLAAPGLAQEPASEADAIAAGWYQRLSDARSALEAARARVMSAEIALGDARQRRRPRGDELSALREELSLAESDLAEREAAWPELLEQARVAGMLPGVLAEFEEPAPTPAE